MRCSVLAAVVFAAAIAAAQGAQSGLYASFPFCKCKKTPTAYKLGDIVTAKGNGQYCFKLSAKVPAGCNDYCCNKADLKKIEFNVNEACDVFGDVVKATINGVPTKVGASFNEPIDGPVGSTTLVLTQLGLGLGSDGAEICITLSKNKNGKGCTTLEELCVPPAGLPKGVCSAALFDSQNDCCPISTPGIPSPPPPSPPPPPPPPSPPPPSPPPPCQVCVYIDLLVSDASRIVFPYAFSGAQCASYIATIQDDIATQAEDLGVTVAPGMTSCSGNKVVVCGTFFSSQEGAKLQSFVDTQISFWLDMVTGGCTPALAGYTVTVKVGGMGDSTSSAGLPESCLKGATSASCRLETPDFPKCACVTTPKATPFALAPTMSTMDGRTKDTTCYCFETTLVTPNSLTSPCGRSSGLLKAEFYADDKKRRAITGIYVQPKGASGKWLSATWGAVGEDTVKATPLNWSKGQANGGKICLELKKDTPLDMFCKPANDGVCWGNLFDDSKDCCPLYAVGQP
ncbi:hypothetical protein HYH02_007420 [Chlamydomonas schloesseri]|uniref:Pherophorin domain-containing protein n=1 Tax=Chlamydomonas schloesseri TaxID=2026947 RepID=A0A835WH41_9CHLO|nr:hypothetical protein HYH02_007420 [Chlamydomonas schloesseri]|eukprot:KAG2447494.1 hypothetical protein HYH02_007420 [Chlamydomonas schloesseri]